MHIVYPLIVRLSLIVIGFVAILGVLYGWLLPEVFKGYRTYSFLLAGLSAAAIVAGYYSFQAADFYKSPTIQWLSAIGIGLLTAILVGFLSFFIIFNLKGS